MSLAIPALGFMVSPPSTRAWYEVIGKNIEFVISRFQNIDRWEGPGISQILWTLLYDKYLGTLCGNHKPLRC